jgi:hypothetical protein
LAIHRDDVGHELPEEKYPLLHTLFYEGINGLFDLAANKYGFKPAESYMSKCHLCLDLRHHLVFDQPGTYRELQPQAFYENI